MLLKLISGIVFDMWDSRTAFEKEEDLKRLKAIKEFTARHPSLRISERGGISVDPAEIIRSPSFQADLLRAKRLVEESNKLSEAEIRVSSTRRASSKRASDDSGRTPDSSVTSFSDYADS